MLKLWPNIEDQIKYYIDTNNNIKLRIKNEDIKDSIKALLVDTIKDNVAVINILNQVKEENYRMSNMTTSSKLDYIKRKKTDLRKYKCYITVTERMKSNYEFQMNRYNDLITKFEMELLQETDDQKLRGTVWGTVWGPEIERNESIDKQIHNITRAYIGIDKKVDELSQRVKNLENKNEF